MYNVYHLHLYFQTNSDIHFYAVLMGYIFLQTFDSYSFSLLNTYDNVVMCGLLSQVIFRLVIMHVEIRVRSLSQRPVTFDPNLAY